MCNFPILRFELFFLNFMKKFIALNVFLSLLTLPNYTKLFFLFSNLSKFSIYILGILKVG